ncbi:MAG TPA: hypothetical protein VGE47_04545, partial [Burkholderiaceae bacterium]
MASPRTVRARQLALLLFFLLAGALTGCGALAPRGSERPAASTNGAAFTLQVRAPEDVRKYLEA